MSTANTPIFFSLFHPAFQCSTRNTQFQWCPQESPHCGDQHFSALTSLAPCCAHTAGAQPPSLLTCTVFPKSFQLCHHLLCWLLFLIRTWDLVPASLSTLPSSLSQWPLEAFYLSLKRPPFSHLRTFVLALFLAWNVFPTDIPLLQFRSQFKSTEGSNGLISLTLSLSLSPSLSLPSSIHLLHTSITLWYLLCLFIACLLSISTHHPSHWYLCNSRA